MPAARDEEWSTIAAQAASGATLQELSEHWNIPVGTLKDRCAREGWKRSARERQEAKTGVAVCPQHPVQPRPTERALGLMDKLKGPTKLYQAKTVHKTAKAFSKLDGEALMSRTKEVKDNVDSASKLWPEVEGQSQPLIAIQLNGYVPVQAAVVE